jgi:hypothetical protein
MGKQPASPASAVIWQGASQFDGQPVIAVITGLRRPSRNPKTGPMAQVWVIRADVTPTVAAWRRQDYAVCGDCRLRGTDGHDRTCYVTLSHAPLAMYKRWRAGRYQELAPAEANQLLRQRHLAVRLGAYGEMPALPVWVTSDLVADVRFTGYTHQWRQPGHAQRFRDYLMASVESLAEARAARALGWRTFRVRTSDQPLGVSEVVCPASAEAGHRTTCEHCGLCNGVGAASRPAPAIHVAIIAHGQGARNFIPLREVSHA